MILKNEYIKCTLDKTGAELKGLYNLESSEEVMWHGDGAWWEGISPILFPFVGTSKNNQYHYGGKTYDIKPHGFLAQREFNIESVKEDEVWFTYESTKEDYELYPFKFKVSVGYRIEWSKVYVNWIVENKDTKDMYYTIGAHPSFLCEEGDILTFETKNEQTYFYHLDGPHISKKEAMEPQRLVMNDDAFPIDTWIYDGIRSATLLNINKGSSIKLDFEDFEFVGVWSPVKEGKMGPFVCIEPWDGLPDFADSNGELETRKTVTILEPNKENAYTYSIEIA